jgi:prenyltransferase beta subunit
LAPKLLGESAPLVRAYVTGELNPDGGFRNRGGDSDLYYTVFGLQTLVALQEAMPTDTVIPFLQRFGCGESLDFVHLGCLARCWAMMPAESRPPDMAGTLASHLEQYRTPEGGYHASPGAEHGTAYHAFLALSAYQDLQIPPPEPDRIAGSVRALRAADGGFANEPGREQGSTPATAAAVALIRHLELPAVSGLADWLRARCREGGFFASPSAPMPDLLSTATALHALTSIGASLGDIRESCLDFIDSLWTSRGAFFGTWADEEPDCEYTFYGLLALGHLAV